MLPRPPSLLELLAGSLAILLPLASLASMILLPFLIPLAILTAAWLLRSRARARRR